MPQRPGSTPPARSLLPGASASRPASAASRVGLRSVPFNKEPLALFSGYYDLKPLLEQQSVAGKSSLELVRESKMLSRPSSASLPRAASVAALGHQQRSCRPESAPQHRRSSPALLLSASNAALAYGGGGDATATPSRPP